MSIRYQRGDAYVERNDGSDPGNPVFVISDGNAQVSVTERTMYWLLFVAGPAVMPPGKTAAELLRERTGR